MWLTNVITSRPKSAAATVVASALAFSNPCAVSLVLLYAVSTPLRHSLPDIAKRAECDQYTQELQAAREVAEEKVQNTLVNAEKLLDDASGPSQKEQEKAMQNLKKAQAVALKQLDSEAEHTEKMHEQKVKEYEAHASEVRVVAEQMLASSMVNIEKLAEQESGSRLVWCFTEDAGERFQVREEHLRKHASAEHPMLVLVAETNRQKLEAYCLLDQEFGGDLYRWGDIDVGVSKRFHQRAWQKAEFAEQQKQFELAMKGTNVSARKMAFPDGRSIGLDHVPLQWDEMGEEICVEVPLDQNFAVEFQSVKDFCKTMPQGTNVKSVKRTENKLVWQLYECAKNAGKNANEKSSFHGDEKITCTGVDTQFGGRIWLSTNSQYSSGYCKDWTGSGWKQILLVRCVLGNTGVDCTHCGNTSRGHTRSDDQHGGGRDNRNTFASHTELYPAYVIEFQYPVGAPTRFRACPSIA